jgi:hypothetical protein
VTAFSMLKQAEWDRYVASGADPASNEISDWELRYYLPFH